MKETKESEMPNIEPLSYVDKLNYKSLWLEERKERTYWESRCSGLEQRNKKLELAMSAIVNTAKVVDM